MDFSTDSAEHFKHLKIHYYDDVYKQAQALSEYVSGSLKAILDQQENAVLAVSGGTSPVLFFQALSLQMLPWERVCVTLVDERVVDPDSDQSNGHLVRSHLLQNQAQEASFLPWVSDISKYQDDLVFLQENFPSIDVAVLGLGTDGHTASWLPQSPQLVDLQDLKQEQSVLFVEVDESGGSLNRFSLTASALQKIPNVVLQFSGRSKSEVFQAALLNNGFYPIQAALPFISDVFISS